MEDLTKEVRGNGTGSTHSNQWMILCGGLTCLLGEPTTTTSASGLEVTLASTAAMNRQASVLFAKGIHTDHYHWMLGVNYQIEIE